MMKPEQRSSSRNSRSSMPGPARLSILLIAGTFGISPPLQAADDDSAPTRRAPAAVTPTQRAAPAPAAAPVRAAPESLGTPARTPHPPAGTAAPVLAPMGSPVAAPLKPPPAMLQLTAKPDYAIALGSQEESENTALAWRFRIENRGKGDPTTEKGGTGPLGLGSKAATLVISVGAPCPNGTGYWTKLAALPLPALKPGESKLFPSQPYRMPDGHIGMGCRFKAEIAGPADDADPSNNAIQMLSKTALLPDLIVVRGVASFVSDGELTVENHGAAPAEPSLFRFECEVWQLDKTCGKHNEDRKPKVVKEVQVPALKPGQSFKAIGSTPKGVAWKAHADYNKSVAESKEGNNTLTGGN